jgi:hypothetical protein
MSDWHSIMGNGEGQVWMTGSGILAMHGEWQSKSIAFSLVNLCYHNGYRVKTKCRMQCSTMQIRPATRSGVRDHRAKQAIAVKK